jgi:hypothetical protein
MGPRVCPRQDSIQIPQMSILFVQLLYCLYIQAVYFKQNERKLVQFKKATLILQNPYYHIINEA